MVHSRAYYASTVFISTTFLSLWHHVEEFHKKAYALLVFIVFYELLKLAPAAVLAIIIDTIIAFEPSALPKIGWLLVTLFVVSMVVSLLDILIEHQSTVQIDFPMEMHLLRKTADKLLRLSLEYHERNNSSKQVHVLHRGVNQLSELVYHACKDIGPTVVQLIVTTIVLLCVNWIAGLTFIAFIPLFIFVIHRYGKRVQPLRQSYHEIMDDAAGFIGERVGNVRTIQDYAVEQRELLSYKDMLAQWLHLATKRMDFHRTYFLYRDTIMNVSRIFIMGVGVWLVLQGEMTAGVLVFFITLSEKANLALFRLTNVYNRAGDSMESVRRLIALFDQEETITQKEDALHVQTLQGDVSFTDVTFAYNDGKNVLHNVSFDVPKKKMLAIIGRSGSGKSTIVKLLYRHYDVQKGAVSIDGTDIRDYSLQEFRRQIALVPQDIEVFNTSVRTNIAFGNPDASQEDVEEVARIAYAHDFITELPDGYDTLVGERGVKLSGGQKQRIGIARALLAKPSILVFDEATSSLDTESEQLIQKAMKDIAKDYTMIVIAHRLSTIEHADTVMVLENGSIVEMGSHEDLLAHKGVYTKMCELQQIGEVR